MEQVDISINLFSNVVIQKLKTVGDYDPESIIEQFLNSGIPITSFSGSLYLWIGGYWQKHLNVDDELKLFIKKSLEKILGKRPLKAQIKQIHSELLTEFIEFEKPKGTLINFVNEILVIDNGSFYTIPHAMQFGMKYKLPFTHDPSQQCPTIDRFMQETIGDAETIEFFYQFIASAFISNDVLHIEKALFLYGSGSNGKSVLLNLLRYLLGELNISHVPLKDVGDETKRIAMVGKLLNIASEGSQRNLESEDFKAMVSREALSVRTLYNNSTTTSDFPRLIFATNNLPQTGGDFSGGLYRKIIIIPFENIVPEEKQDKQLLSKLLPELPTILAYMNDIESGKSIDNNSLNLIFSLCASIY